MRNFVAVVLLLAFGVAGYIWFTGDSFAFRPEPGDTRHFILEQSTRLQSPGQYRGASTHVRMESLLRSEVLAVEPDSVEVQSRALHTQLWEDDKLALDTENVPEYQGRVRLMSELLKAGVVERIASDGRVLETSYVNEQAMAELAEESRLTGAVRDLLLRDLSPMYAYQPEFPSGKARVGMTWQTEARDMAGQPLPALRYEVSHMDDESVSLTFQSVGQTGVSEAASVQVEGFMELERGAGWPRRAAARIKGEFEYAGEQVDVNSLFTLEQAGMDSRFNADELWHRAFGAVDGFEVDTSDPNFETYYLPPFGPYSPEESFARLDRTLLWFGTDEVDGRQGLEFLSEFDDFVTVQFGPASAVRLLNADGTPVIDDAPADPRYTLYPLDRYQDAPGHRPVPFIASEMTSDQLEAIATVELDAEVTVPGELYSVVLTPDAPEKQIEALGLTLSVKDWNPDQLRVQSHRPGGELPESYPLIAAYPVDAEGEILSVFTMRLTHTLLEPLREAFMKEASGDAWAVAESFAAEATEQVQTLPLEERRGDWLFDLKARGSQAIEGVQVYAYGTETRMRTFVAPSALPTLQGGPVVGERTLEEHRVPELDFEKFEIDDVTMEGVEQNWLSVVESESAVGRCDVSLEGEPTYQGSPVRLAGAGRHLTTGHGLKFFYDLDIAVNIDCITDVAMHTGPVPAEGPLTRSDPHTLRLSNAQLRKLSEIRRWFNLDQLPVIAYNREGEALEPLSPAYSGKAPEDWDGDGLDLRFWGEIAEIRYPARMERETRQLSVQFPPLP